MYWKAGYKVVLVADQVLIYSAGHRGFRIDLSLSQGDCAAAFVAGSNAATQ